MLISTQDQRSITLPVIVTVLSVTTSRAQMPTLLAMVITLILLLLPQKTYKSYNLELTVLTQNQVVTISDVRDLHIKGLERNGSPNPNSMGYKLLTCLRDDQKSLWYLPFQREPWKRRLSFYLACQPREIATGNAPWLAACVHSLKKPQSLISCITMPAAK